MYCRRNTILTRYDEIMDRIVVTEEMRDRILTNIDQEMRETHRAHKRRKTRPTTTWLPALAAAAVLLVVCGVAYGNYGRGNGATGSTEIAAATEEGEADLSVTTSTGGEEIDRTANLASAQSADAQESSEDSAHMEDVESAAIYAPEFYNSAEELSEAIGFEIKDLKSIPFAIASIEYYAIDDDLAEIDYRSMGNECSLTWRKSNGTEDNSGDYNVYDTNESTEIADCDVTLRGEGDRYYLAVWTDGAYAYSISLSDGCTYDELTQVIVEAMY